MWPLPGLTGSPTGLTPKTRSGFRLGGSQVHEAAAGSALRKKRRPKAGKPALGIVNHNQRACGLTLRSLQDRPPAWTKAGSRQPTAPCLERRRLGQSGHDDIGSRTALNAGALNLNVEVVHAAPLVTQTVTAFCREIQQSAWFAAPRKKPRHGGFGASPVLIPRPREPLVGDGWGAHDYVTSSLADTCLVRWILSGIPSSFNVVS
jgi:hypothetical protein